ncbi:MAG: hypothetical protein ACXU82_10410 [Caulobacteraceae bacterium]
MSEAAVALAALFAIGMMGIGLALFVRAAREEANTRNSWPHWPPTELR